MEYASRNQRLTGQVLDGVVAASPLLLAVIVDSVTGTLGTLLAIAALVFSVWYYFFADGLEGGKSIGKRWLGIQVVDADSYLPCSFWQSFLRNLLLAVLGPIDWIFIFGKRHQRLGDKAANTIVIRDA